MKPTYNTTEENKIKGILAEICNFDEYTEIERANMVYAMEVYGNKRHNLALSQVLEEIENLDINLTGDGYHREEQIKSIITSLQKE